MSEKQIPAYEDTDPMPFGMHKNKSLQDVPASYLLWLSRGHIGDERLHNYIQNSMSALRLECPDFTP